jgi:hypothetical protein
MRLRLLAIAAFCASAMPVSAQSDEDLAKVAEGWGRGRCDALTQVAINPQSGEWTTLEQTPYTTWTIRKIGPQSVEYTMAGGLKRRVDLADGMYRDRAPDPAPAVDMMKQDWTIIEHGILAPDNWRLLMDTGSAPGDPEGLKSFSEMIMAGDVFVWTNWMEENGGPRRRVMYAVCKYVDE